MNEQFNRHVSEELIDTMKKTQLWKNYLRADCETGEVFLAIRHGYISFYHKGGGLFTFDENGVFRTHIKYASVIDSDDERNYLSEADLSDKKLIANFADGYAAIKQNCARYSGIEAEGVSYLCKNSPYILDKEDVVVLDIEVAFKNQDGKQDRIDILLYSYLRKKV
jgi:protein associated with RNAse G/E